MSSAKQANDNLSKLVSIAAKIENYISRKETIVKDSNNAAKADSSKSNIKDISAITSMSTSLTSLIKEVNDLDNKAGDKLASFITNTSTAIIDANKNGLTIDIATEVNKSLLIIAEGSNAILKNMAIGSILGIPAMIGATLFGKTISILSNSLSKINPVSEEDLNTIETIINIGKMSGKFLLSMSAYAILGIPAMIGATLFGSTLAIFMGIVNKVDAVSKSTEESIQNILSLSKGAALFALTMVGIGLVAKPFALGTLTFTLAVSAMLLTFSAVGFASLVGVHQLDILAVSALKFSLSMIAVGVLAPLFALGVITFTLGVAAMLKVFSTISTVKDWQSIITLMVLGKSAAKFALTMTLVGVVAPLFALGVIVFSLGVAAVLKVFNTISTVKDWSSIAMLWTMGKSVVRFAVSMIAIGFFAQQFALGTLAFVLAMGAVSLAFSVMGKNFVSIERGVLAFNTMNRSILPFTAIMIGAGYFAKEIVKGGLAISAALLAVGGATSIVGFLDKTGNVTTGSKTILGLILPMIGFSSAIAILGLIPISANDLFLKLGAIAASIVGLGLAAYALGIPAVAPFALVGAGILVVLGASLVIFSGALLLLSKAKFEKTSTDALSYTISTIGKSLAMFGLIAIPAAIGAAALIPISFALLPLTYSLEKFKSINWAQSDGESLKNALHSIVHGFSNALDGIGILGLAKLVTAVPVIALIGNALTSLASGIKSMATLTFIESEWDEKAGKLVQKRVVKLTDAEIRAVGPNVSSLLSSMAMPLTEFGKWAKDGALNIGPFSLGSSYMEDGIEVASKIGNIFSTLAQGVKRMANLEVVTYEIVGKGTKNAKLVPKDVVKLSSNDFVSAGNNVNTILSNIAIPLTSFGEQYSKGIGLFDGEYLNNGIEGASKIGGIIGTIGAGIHRMAKGEIITYKIFGKGTKDAKLIPDAVVKLTPTDYSLAADNVRAILKAIQKPLIDFGVEYSKGTALFDNNYMQIGIEAISTIIDPISKLADIVIKLAGGEIQSNKVIDDGKGGKKIVLSNVKSFSDVLPSAISMANNLLTGVAGIIINFASYVKSNEDSFSIVEKFMPRFNSLIDYIGKISEKYKKITETNESQNITTDVLGMISSKVMGFLSSISEERIAFGEKILPRLQNLLQKTVLISNDYLKISTNFLTASNTNVNAGIMLSTFSKSLGNIIKQFDASTDKSLLNYQKFTSITEKLVGISTPLTKFTKAFGQFGKEMNTFIKTWKLFSNGDISNFKSYSDSLKSIASIDGGRLKENIKSLKDYEDIKLEQSRANANESSNPISNFFSQASTPAPVAKPQAEVKTETVKPEKLAANALKDGSVIANLVVTNLYINGKLASN